MTPPDEVTAAIAAVLAGSRGRDVETERLELKVEVPRSAGDTLRMLAESASCLANGQGGCLLVGIADDRAGREAIVGCDLRIETVRHRIFELTEPGLVVDLEEVPCDGRRLLVISVPTSPTVHAVGGRSTERVGTSCVRMAPDRIAAVITDRRGDDWSAHDSGRPISDADPQALTQARTLLQRVPDPVRRGFARLSDADVLRALGVVTTGSTLTHAGVLLFTPRLEPAERLVYLFRRTPTGALGANERLEGPMLLVLERLFFLVDARMDRTPVNVSRGQQLQIPDLPEDAVREAVVNAVMHRDYRRVGPVVVDHTPSRFAVTSPGPFLVGITPDNVLTTSSRSRNPQLATAVRSLGLAETAGTGVDRMYAAMARTGHQPPAYTAGLDSVQVAMLGGAPNAYVARYAASLPVDEAEDADTMLILLTMLTQRTITATAVAPLLQRDAREAQAVLGRLAAPPVDMLEPTRQTAHRTQPSYRLRRPVIAALGTAVVYNRRTVDDSHREVIDIVRETGQVNGRAVRLLLGVDTVTASRLLADLVGRGVLVKSSTAQRGPSVMYGPGPQFPSRRAPRHTSPKPSGPSQPAGDGKGGAQ